MHRLAGCLALYGLMGCAASDWSALETQGEAVHAVLDDFHQAASDVDLDRYLGHLADDGIYLGTDATERWTKEEFRGFCTPYFAEGIGWTYVPDVRHVELSDDGRFAWFDETLSHERYGTLRGNGVLRRESDGAWRIAQYDLTFLIPNEVAKDVVALIRERTS